MARIKPAFKRHQPPAVVPDDVGVIDEADLLPDMPLVPHDWILGQLLNVRATGYGWNITLYPDEFDARYPERAMVFTHYGQCQDFISKWYARQYHDPRA